MDKQRNQHDRTREVIYHSGDTIKVGDRIKWYDSDEGHFIYGDVDAIVDEEGFVFLLTRSLNTGLHYKVFRGSVVALIVWD